LVEISVFENRQVKSDYSSEFMTDSEQRASEAQNGNISGVSTQAQRKNGGYLSKLYISSMLLIPDEKGNTVLPQ
jgi:hypothetical protein